MPSHRPLVVSHRGSWKHEPENSLAALDESIALGADMVEIDVQTTVDDVLVVFHDDMLDRVTSGSGNLCDHTAAALGQIFLRKPDGSLSSERIPLLSEMLARARGRILLNLDLKSDGLADRVAAAVLAADMAGQVLMKAKVQGPDDIAWALARQFNGRIGFMPLMTALPQHFVHDLQQLRVLEPTMVEVSFNDLQHMEPGRSVLRQQNILLWVNTLDVCHNLDLCDARALEDPDAVWGVLIEAGVGAIQTDEAEALVAYLRQREMR